MKKLSLEKMEVIKGGVPLEEYCDTLSMIMCNNPISGAMENAWYTHCAYDYYRYC